MPHLPHARPIAAVVLVAGVSAALWAVLSPSAAVLRAVPSRSADAFVDSIGVNDELDGSGRVIEFHEKPEIPPGTLASTGIYLFNKDILVDRLQADAARVSSHDFGRDILPDMIEGYRVFGYPLQSYWRDVGTVEAYWQANMDLLVDLPAMNLYDPDSRVHTRVANYPPAKIGPTAHVSRVIGDMVGLRVHRLFVVDDDGVLVGVITTMDVLKRLQP